MYVFALSGSEVWTYSVRSRSLVERATVYVNASLSSGAFSYRARAEQRAIHNHFDTNPTRVMLSLVTLTDVVARTLRV